VHAHLALVGPTAAGKSALALDLVRARPGMFEIVSADSMQVYRGMDIGTAKPSPAEQAEVPHHLLDVADPSEEFTVARFQVLARAAIADIEGRGRRALLVGGTGLYVRAVVDDLTIPGQWPDTRDALEAEVATTGPEALHARLVTLDPVAAARIEPGNTRRLVRALEVTLASGRPFSAWGPGLEAHGPSPFRLIGVAVPPDELRRRIDARFDAQLAAGLVDEVRALAAHPSGLSRTARQAIGYRELLAHVEGALALDEAVELAVTRTRQLARRQRAWFRRDPRIDWIAPDAATETLLDRADHAAD
jgi:tRNA dimethylallyltransferase